MTLTHLQLCGVGLQGFWLLKRRCYRIKASPWGEEQSFLSANTKLELSREFWKVLSGLPCFKRSLKLSDCNLLWFLVNDPFYLLNSRLPTVPLLPSQITSCMPSVVHSLLWVFAICVCAFDHSGYTKVTGALKNTHATASKGSLRRMKPSVHSQL